MRLAKLGLAACGLVLVLGLCAGAQAGTRPQFAPDTGTRGHRISPALDGHATNLPYSGGPVLHRNRTHLIFWEPAGSGLSFDPGYESLVETFLHNVAAASRSPGNVYGLTGQYRDDVGPAAYVSSYGGAVVATDPLPPNGCSEPPATGPGWQYCLTDSQLQREIEHVVHTDALPTGHNDVYFLVTPDGLGNCFRATSKNCALGGDANGYCAYHSQTNDGLVLYAVIPYNAVPGHCQSDNPRPNASTADPALSTISHEHSEMITDPTGYAWIEPQSGDEDGDLCLTSFGPDIGGMGSTAWNETINGGHYYLQEEWSNADGACEPRAKADSLWFSIRPVRGRPGTFTFAARARARDGAIVAYQWFFGDRRISRGRRVIHHYGHFGSYRVVLRTTDSWGNWSFYARAAVVSGGGAGGAARATKSG